MNGFLPILKRELLAYFRSPVAYVFIIIFLVANAGCTFLLGNFYDSQQASLEIFFLFHPWLYLPVRLTSTVFAKFSAGWLFIGVSLMLTFPMIWTVHFLGSPDSGPIITGYLGSFLMAGSYLAIASLTSSMTKNQVISFILSVVICLLLILSGWGVLSETLNTVFPVWFSDLVGQFSFTTHFDAIRRGVVDIRDLIYFISIIVIVLMLNVVVLESHKAS